MLMIGITADFSHALLVDNAYPTYNDPAGVIYWQVSYRFSILLQHQSDRDIKGT